MKIIAHLTHKEIKACVKFYYKGYEISVSNIYSSANICIFGGKDFTVNLTEEITGESCIYADGDGMKKVFDCIDKI